MKNNKYELYRDVMKKRNLQLEKWCGVPENPVFLYLQIMIQTMSDYRPNDYQTSKLIWRYSNMLLMRHGGPFHDYNCKQFIVLLRSLNSLSRPYYFWYPPLPLPLLDSWQHNIITHQNLYAGSIVPLNLNFIQKSLFWLLASNYLRWFSDPGTSPIIRPCLHRQLMRTKLRD